MPLGSPRRRYAESGTDAGHHKPAGNYARAAPLPPRPAYHHRNYPIPPGTGISETLNDPGHEAAASKHGPRRAELCLLIKGNRGQTPAALKTRKQPRRGTERAIRQNIASPPSKRAQAAVQRLFGAYPLRSANRSRLNRRCHHQRGWLFKRRSRQFANKPQIKSGNAPYGKQGSQGLQNCPVCK